LTWLQEAARLDAMLEAYVKKRYEKLAKLAGGGAGRRGEAGRVDLI
jgi:hypothetical protein